MNENEKKGCVMMSHQYPVEYVIRNRRTIKKFKPDSISIDQIKELLDIAIWAPTHKMREPWRFIIIIDEAREAFVEAISFESQKGKDAVPMKQAKIDHWLSIPAYVVMVMEEDPRQHQWDEDYAAVSALIQNFQLAAWEKGIGMLWNTNKHIYSPTIRKELGVMPGERIVGVMQVGYPAHIPTAVERTPVEEKLTVFSKRDDIG